MSVISKFNQEALNNAPLCVDHQVQSVWYRLGGEARKSAEKIELYNTEAAAGRGETVESSDIPNDDDYIRLGSRHSVIRHIENDGFYEEKPAVFPVHDTQTQRTEFFMRCPIGSDLNTAEITHFEPENSQQLTYKDLAFLPLLDESLVHRPRSIMGQSFFVISKDETDIHLRHDL